MNASLVWLILTIVIPLAAFVTFLGTAWNTLRLLAPNLVPFPRRHLAYYKVHYDASIEKQAMRQIEGIGKLAKLVIKHHGEEVKAASVAMIRISNNGALHIEESDWSEPISFRFDNRKVLGIEVSESDAGERLLGPVVRHVVNGKDPYKLELPCIPLRKGQKFRFLVLLSGSRPHGDGGDNGVTPDGSLIRPGRGTGFVPEPPTRKGAIRIACWAAAWVVCFAAAFVLIAVKPSSPPADCGSGGTLVAAGSTAFATSFSALQSQYQKKCPGSPLSLSSDAQGSAQAATVVKSMQGFYEPGQPNLVMSDGALDPHTYSSLTGQPVAVVIFSVVVNQDIGVRSLTIAQLRQIWAGRFHYWSQVSPGLPHEPISIVSRNPGSGTRTTFDSKILGSGSEPSASSPTCSAASPDAPVARCAEENTDSVLQVVNGLPGAIGYAETEVATTTRSSLYQKVALLQINGVPASAPNVERSQNAYPFWAVEHFYTYGTPPGDSLLQSFLSYVKTAPAASVLSQSGDIPCTGAGTALCDSSP